MKDYTIQEMQQLMEAHRTLIHSAANDQDSYSLAQPSPDRYVPSFATDRTTQNRNDLFLGDSSK